MKQLILLAITFVIGQSTFGQNDPVIMTIDDKEITKTEFLQIYLKNNNDPKYDKASLDEYVELFTKFKLKVAEAEAPARPVPTTMISIFLLLAGLTKLI